MNVTPLNPTPVPQSSARDLAALEDEITELAAHLKAATYRLLTLIREFDERHGWSGAGMKSCAHWLNWKCGIALGATREKVRVAHVLKARLAPEQGAHRAGTRCGNGKRFCRNVFALTTASGLLFSGLVLSGFSLAMRCTDSTPLNLAIYRDKTAVRLHGSVRDRSLG